MKKNRGDICSCVFVCLSEGIFHVFTRWTAHEPATSTSLLISVVPARVLFISIDFGSLRLCLYLFRELLCVVLRFRHVPARISCVFVAVFLLLSLPFSYFLSQLALKHRRNKHGGQRIIVFVSSPIEDEVIDFSCDIRWEIARGGGGGGCVVFKRF